MSRWKFIREGTEYLHSVGIEADGSLYNPNGYPAERVRALVLAAEERRRVRRSNAAKKAGATRGRRREKRVYEIARRFMQEGRLSRSLHCDICGRGLSDEESIERGIGSECWQGVLDCIAEIRGPSKP